MKYHVFISYAHADEGCVRQIEKELTKRGFVCWRDYWVNVAADFEEVIEQAIADSQIALVVVSAASANSDWVLREVRMAQQRRRPVLPVVLNGGSQEGMVGGLERLQRFPIKMSGNGIATDSIAALAAELERLGVRSLNYRTDTALDRERVRQVLPALEKEDLQRLELLSARTAQHFRGTPGAGHWTVHGLRHSNALVQLLDPLLPDEVRCSRPLSFALAAAACLHDWGRLSRCYVALDKPRRRGDRSSFVGEKVQSLPREQHHLLARQTVLSVSDDTQLDATVMRTITDLCYYHNHRTRASELLDLPGTGLAAAVFRAANALDLGPTRAPDLYWRTHWREVWGEGANGNGTPLHEELTKRATAGTQSEQLDRARRVAAAGFWLQNLVLEDVALDRDAREVLIDARVPHSLHFIPKQIQTNLARLLADLQPLIGRWRVHLRELPAQGPAAPLPLPLAHMVLLGARLYSDPRATMRSSSDIADYLVQSVIAVAEEAQLSPRKRQQVLAATVEKPLSPDEAVEVLQATAAHLVAERPELHVLHWLRRELKDAAKTGGLTAVRSRFAYLGRRRACYPLNPSSPDSPYGAIAHAAAQQFERAGLALGRTEHTLLVFGLSGPVEAFISYLALQQRTVRVLTPLMRPVGDGPSCQALGLAQVSGVTVELIPDAALAYVLGRTAPRAKKIDLALMGCEAFMPDGSIANSLGALGFAQLADANRVPLWVLTEEAKGWKHVEKSPYHKQGQGRPPRSPRVPELPVAAFIHEPAAATAISAATTEYPRSEVVPAALVKRLITEKGVVRRFEKPAPKTGECPRA